MNHRLILATKDMPKHSAVMLRPVNFECKHTKVRHRAREVNGAIRCVGCDNLCTCPEGVEHDQLIGITK